MEVTEISEFSCKSILMLNWKDKSLLPFATTTTVTNDDDEELCDAKDGTPLPVTTTKARVSLYVPH